MTEHKLKELDLISQGWEKSSETPEYTLFRRGRERLLAYRDGKEIIYKTRDE